MNRIAEIFIDVRDTLNDQKAQRWSDETLLRALRLGIKDIALHTKIFKDSVAIPLVNGQDVYPLPDNLLSINYASYDWKPILIRSTEWMNQNRESDWPYTTGDTCLSVLVFDNVKRHTIKTYPRPFGDFSAEYAETDAYGVTESIDGYEEIESPYGLISSLVDEDANSDSMPDLYGLLGSMHDTSMFIVYYTKCPDLPETKEDDIPLDECFDTALQYYITARALKNDLDVQNRDASKEEFGYYQRELSQVMEIAETDSVAAPFFESHYNPMG